MHDKFKHIPLIMIDKIKLNADWSLDTAGVNHQPRLIEGTQSFERKCI